MIGNESKEEKIRIRKKRILAYIKDESYKPLTFDELAMVLDVPREDVEIFRSVMEELEAEGKVLKTKKNRFCAPERIGLIAGRLQGNERGYGFVIPDEGYTGDIFIPADGLNGAMHNDRVIARITGKTVASRRSAEGEIVRITERAIKTVVGTFEKSRYFGFVIPDDKRICGDIFIPADEMGNAVSGDKVVAEIVKWPEKRRNAEGKIIEVLGGRNEAGIDVLAVMKVYGLEEEFPQAVMRQAKSLPDTVTEDMLIGRRDLRQLRMVTIDSEDAKDLDDAVSIQRLDGNKYRLGVHIADVSHYVTENSPLDREALKRGTSVYLVDRVIPMLPKSLSNGICSLNPGVDRLALTVMMDIDSSGRVVNHDIFESVINIDERMTYTDVFKMLTGDTEGLDDKYGYLLDDFKTMEELALILRKKRMGRGAIDFDFAEAKITLDDEGRPIDIKRYEITTAHRIIEEFMLVCNETIAERFFWEDIPFLYRIHEDPDTEKMELFAEFVKNLGYPIKKSSKIHPRTLQSLLTRIKGAKEELVISTVMLRSLAKARYSHINHGHFGLSAKFYCHFTSPIRRYPDLIIHRIIKEHIRGALSSAREEELNEKLPDIAAICSDRERKAQEAERETEDIKKAEFMKRYEGEFFEGIISNVTSFGIFVQLENTVEGLVRMESMEDDYYVFDEKRYCLIGERTRKKFRIGDKVNIQVARVDTASRKIEFIIADTAQGAVDESVINGDRSQESRKPRKNDASKSAKERKIRKSYATRRNRAVKGR